MAVVESEGTRDDLVFLITIVQPSTLRISRETSTVHEAGYRVEQDNTQLNLAILSISSDTRQPALPLR
jgi:hypothetical protein